MPRLHPGRLAVAFCVSVLSFTSATVAQSTPSSESSQFTRGVTASPSEAHLPDSPGAIWAKSQEPQQENPSAQSTTPRADTPQTDSPESDAQHEKLQRPVGTAAAEAPKVSGVTAAQPAGAAIAPAKQRRVRTIVLKVGAILGASAAIGTVIALSAATPSKPPGAH
jgi:hypothetical protein